MSDSNVIKRAHTVESFRGKLELGVQVTPSPDMLDIKVIDLVSHVNYLVVSESMRLLGQLDVLTDQFDAFTKPKKHITLQSTAAYTEVAGKLKLSAALCRDGVAELQAHFSQAIAGVINEVYEVDETAVRLRRRGVLIIGM